MARKKVYLETSVISFLAARDSRDVVLLAKQQLTREWWDRERRHFDLVVGQPVMEEIRLGDPEAVDRRLTVIADLESLPLTGVAKRLAGALVKMRLIPPNALVDAFHVSIAATNEVDFLMTWNCSHINNAHTVGRISEAIASAGFRPPVMATPETLWRKRR